MSRDFFGMGAGRPPLQPREVTALCILTSCSTKPYRKHRLHTICFMYRVETKLFQQRVSHLCRVALACATLCSLRSATEGKGISPAC